MRKLPIFFSGVPAFFGATDLVMLVAAFGSSGGVLSKAIGKWFCYTKATECNTLSCNATQVSLHHALLSAAAVEFFNTAKQGARFPINIDRKSD